MWVEGRSTHTPPASVTCSMWATHTTTTAPPRGAIAWRGWGGGSPSHAPRPPTYKRGHGEALAVTNLWHLVRCAPLPMLGMQDSIGEHFSERFSTFDPTIYIAVIALLVAEILMVVVPIVVKVLPMVTAHCFPVPSSEASNSLTRVVPTPALPTTPPPFPCSTPTDPPPGLAHVPSSLHPSLRPIPFRGTP